MESEPDKAKQGGTRAHNRVSTFPVHGVSDEKHWGPMTEREKDLEQLITVLEVFLLCW